MDEINHKLLFSTILKKIALERQLLGNFVQGVGENGISMPNSLYDGAILCTSSFEGE